MDQSLQKCLYIGSARSSCWLLQASNSGDQDAHYYGSIAPTQQRNHLQSRFTPPVIHQKCKCHPLGVMPFPLCVLCCTLVFHDNYTRHFCQVGLRNLQCILLFLVQWNLYGYLWIPDWRISVYNVKVLFEMCALALYFPTRVCIF